MSTSSSRPPSDETPIRDQVQSYIYDLQHRIVTALEAIPAPSSSAPPLKFNKREWTREEGGGGIAYTTTPTPASYSTETSTDASGVGWMEKGAVNVSMIHGMLSPPAIKQMSTEHAALRDEELSKAPLPFFAGGISIILHPRNPHVPSVHANYRYMEITSPSPSSSTTATSSDPTSSPSQQQPLTWWFGFITDLTPTYAHTPHFTHFHKTLKSTLDAHSPILYPAFKKSCDDYFWIEHRKEHRGVGGVRVDNFGEGPHVYFPDEGKEGGEWKRPRTKEGLFKMLKDVGDAFLPSYIPILIDPALSPSPTLGLSTLATPWTPQQKRWQLIRRGRSIEFTLVYERGTKFGLAAKGVNVENVLASMPEAAGWEYCSELGNDWEGEDEATKSEEGKMLRILKEEPMEWAA